MSGGRKPLGKQRGRWEDAVWRCAVNLLQVRDRRAPRKREVGGRRSGRPWPKNGLKHHRRNVSQPYIAQGLANESTSK